MKILAFSAFLLAAPLTPLAAQAVHTYTITGTGSGSLNGSSFSNASFDFTLTGNSVNLSGNVLNPLTSAVIGIDGFQPVTVGIPTLLGLNQSLVYFSQAGSSTVDLFDFNASQPVDLSTSFGPVTGTGVFALGQFANISTTGGLLTFSSASNVQFQSGIPSAVPEAGTWALMLLGFGAVGIAMRYKGRYRSSGSVLA